jgi:hypothetical protein
MIEFGRLFLISAGKNKFLKRNFASPMLSSKVVRRYIIKP